MAIQGPYPDGGYEIWCANCGGKVTCFGLEELFYIPNDNRLRRFITYQRWVCKDCKEHGEVMDTSETLTEEEQELLDTLTLSMRAREFFENLEEEENITLD